MTAKEKIEEALDSLKKLDHLNRLDFDEKKFQFELSHFLNACYSISGHLLEEFNLKFNLGLDYVDVATFRKKARELKNQKALDFIEWYAKEQQNLRSQESYGFLWARRRHSVHKQTVNPEKGIVIGRVSVTIPSGKKFVWNEKRAWRFFEENKKESDVIVCAKFLGHIERIVNDSKKFA